VIESSKVIRNKSCIWTWLFDEFYRALNELILLKLSQRGQRYPSMSTVDSSNSRCAVGPNGCLHWMIIDTIISWWVPDEWVSLGFGKKHCRCHSGCKPVNSKRNVRRVSYMCFYIHLCD